MALESIPFWEIMILTILPITIGILIFIRIIDIIKEVILRIKELETIFMEVMGKLVLFLVFLFVIIQIIIYMIGTAPSGFDIFTFLIDEMLPLTVYAILGYVMLVQLQILLERGDHPT